MCIFIEHREMLDRIIIVYNWANNKVYKQRNEIGDFCSVILFVLKYLLYLLMSVTNSVVVQYHNTIYIYLFLKYLLN